MADEEKKTYKFVCNVCGYEVEVDTPELPDDYVCPVCGVGPDMFERVETSTRQKRCLSRQMCRRNGGHVLLLRLFPAPVRERIE